MVHTDFYSVLFRAVSFNCREQPSTQVLHLPMSFAVLVLTISCCPTMSSLQQCFGLPIGPTPFICISVLLHVHPLPFTLAMCLAHFHFALVMKSAMLYSTQEVTDSNFKMYLMHLPMFLWKKKRGKKKEEKNHKKISQTFYRKCHVRFVSAWPVMANVLAASDACTLGLLKWITCPSSLIMFTCKSS